MAAIVNAKIISIIGIVVKLFSIALFIINNAASSKIIVERNENSSLLSKSRRIMGVYVL
jgi:hypothetical protein